MEPHPATVAIEEDARHGPPRALAQSYALQAREPETEALLVVRRLDPGRMLRAHEEQGTAGGIRTTDIDELLTDVRVELDAPPRERPWIEVWAVTLRLVITLISKESKALLIREHPVPTKCILLSVHRPCPREIERILKRVERDVEHDDRLGIVRVEVGSLLGTNPRELSEIDTLLDATYLEGREHVDGRVEHAVDEILMSHSDLPFL